MNNYGNKKAFSLMIAILLTIVMALLAFYILEYMVPFSKNIKGIENASKAYYQAESAVEEGLYEMKIGNLGDEPSSTFGGDAISNSYDITAVGKELPLPGQGNSEYDEPDNNWNIIRSGMPIQLEVGDKKLGAGASANINLYFRVPDIDTLHTETLSGSSTPIINWQLSSETNVLNSSGSWITETEIDGTDILLKTLQGFDLDGFSGPNQKFNKFYQHNCGAGSGCILKLSVINKLELSTNNTPVPYIEWQATTVSEIPLRYTIIDTSGKSHGFKKDLKVKVPQQTVNEAFDFTVFQ